MLNLIISITLLMILIIQRESHFVYWSIKSDSTYIEMTSRRMKPAMLLYPHYSHDCYNLVVWPMRILHNFSVPMIQPIRENGVVFYVYSADRCKSSKRYFSEVGYNARLIKEKFSNVMLSILSYNVG